MSCDHEHTHQLPEGGRICDACGRSWQGGAAPRMDLVEHVREQLAADGGAERYANEAKLRYTASRFLEHEAAELERVKRVRDAAGLGTAHDQGEE